MIDSDRVEDAVNQFVEAYKNQDLQTADAAVVDEISRFNPQQVAAAYIYMNALTEDARRTMLREILTR